MVGVSFRSGILAVLVCGLCVIASRVPYRVSYSESHGGALGFKYLRSESCYRKGVLNATHSKNTPDSVSNYPRVSLQAVFSPNTYHSARSTPSNNQKGSSWLRGKKKNRIGTILSIRLQAIRVQYLKNPKLFFGSFVRSRPSPCFTNESKPKVSIANGRSVIAGDS